MPTRSQFQYQLPEALIANQPATPRDHCRLLVFDRQTASWEHHYFYDLPTILGRFSQKFCLVRNDSRVIPARLLGQKTSGGHVEVFLTRQIANKTQAQEWECLTKPGLKPGQQVIFPQQDFHAECISITSNYTRIISFPYTLENFRHFVQEYGKTPIPPYIHSALSESQLREVYQTVYAHEAGSVAAPTAGLHFTQRLNEELVACGHQFIDVTLHVGLGTFLGVKTEDLSQHHMHAEYYRIIPAQLRSLAHAVATGQPLLAIGTTATRVLESIYSRIICDNNSTASSSAYSRNSCNNSSQPRQSAVTQVLPLPHQRHYQLRPELDLSQPLTGETEIFLYPPAPFQLTDHLLTNFHLPESTLLMLVSSLAAFPNSNYHFTTWSESPLGHAYQEAIERRYQFFSFGDAMLII
ncbi:S-adenosylmethionine:tRNA ribosyltransferase-isomerase [bacterium]|nr:S-adenosylmethionine:tRNA ribosyltransferase-isomerase [bacterium]